MLEGNNFELDYSWRSIPTDDIPYFKGREIRLNQKKDNKDKDISLYLYLEDFVIDILQDGKWKNIDKNENRHFEYDDEEMITALKSPEICSEFIRNIIISKAKALEE